MELYPAPTLTFLDRIAFWFQNSALYAHLKEAGYSYEDISPQTLASVIENVKESFGHDAEQNEKAEESNESEFEEKVPQIQRRRLQFSCKRFLLNTLTWFFGWNAWKSEAKEHQQQFAYETVDDILNTVILEHDDFEFLDKFYTSIKERFRHESDSIGEYFKHISIFIVVLGYGILRVIQMKNTGKGGMQSFAGDCLVVGLMVCVLVPSVIKIVAVERLKLRLRRVKKHILKHILELERVHKLFRKSIRLIQETEIVARGFTLASKQTPVSRLELGGTGDLALRQCPLLRKMVFHTARSVMLTARQETEKLLEIYPIQEQFDDAPSFLSLLPLEQYGPCVLIRSEEDEAKLVEATDNYSIAAVKGMTQLCHAHTSEWLRVLALCCLLKHQTTNQGFCSAFENIFDFCENIYGNVTRLEYSYLSHKSQLNAEREEPRPDIEKNEAYSIYVAVHSLSLHLRAAFNRLQNLESGIEKECEGEKVVTSMMQSDWRDHLKVIEAELAACRDCWEESMKRVNTCTQRQQEEQKGDGQDFAERKIEEAEEREKKTVPRIDVADPVIEDQVFEAYTDPAEINSEAGDGDFLSDDEKQKRKEEQQEAVRVLRELRSVIAVRATETRERERRALERMQGSRREVHKAVTSDTANELGGLPESREESGSNSDLSQVSSNDKESVTVGSNIQSKSVDFKGDQLPSVLRNIPSGFPRQTPETGTYPKYDCQSRGDIAESQSGLLCQESQGRSSHEHETSGSRDISDASRDMENSQLDFRDSLVNKLAQMPGCGFPFAPDVAALAVARSREMQALSEDTFGDDSDSENDQH